MRIESSVTSISWIPSEAIRGLPRLPFSTGVAHYDEAPPADIGPPEDGQLEELGGADRYRPDASVRLLLPEQDADPMALLARVMSPPHFPIKPDELRGEWIFRALAEGAHELEGFRVVAREIPHKGGRTFGFRVSDGRTALAYLSDHAPQNLGPGPEGLGEYHEAARELVEGADVLIYDAQYTAAELADRGHFGHTAAEYAAGLAHECGVGRVMLFHHDPARTDDEVDDLLTGVRATAHLPIDVAREDDFVVLRS